MPKDKEKFLKDTKKNYKLFKLPALKSSRREVVRMSKGASLLAKECKKFLKIIDAEISVRLHAQFDNGNKKMVDIRREEREIVA